MIDQESIKYSLRNLRKRKGRSVLTILSIFVGIAAIFVFVSFGNGLFNYVNEFTSESSIDKISIMPKGLGAPGLDDKFALTEADLRAIERTPGIAEASGIYSKVAEVKQKDMKKYAFLIGYDPKNPLIFELLNVGIEKGRILSSNDDGKVVLGNSYSLDEKVFPRAFSLNEKIEIQGQEARVIGFFESVGNPQDDAQIYVTLDYAKELYGDKIVGYGWIVARVEDPKKIDEIVENVERSLRNSRGLKKGEEDFFVQSFQDMIATYSSVLNGIVGFVILIALLSVLVSAINTSNTMITSVLERVREIGVMKSVGARNSRVFGIFIFESGFLGFIAGVIGVLIGWGLSYIGGRILLNLGWGFLQPDYSIALFLGLITFATLTGALSGMIPAVRASRISPVEALRHE